MDADVIAILLGSSVLAGVLGAYAQSFRQREEQFRERMIEAALEFLSEETEAEKHLLSIGHVSDAVDDSIDAGNRAWTAVPLLAIVFPDDSVASAASELLHVIEDARNSLVKAGGALAEKERGDIERARANFTRVTQEAIRKRAFRTKFFRWSILSRG